MLNSVGDNDACQIGIASDQTSAFPRDVDDLVGIQDISVAHPRRPRFEYQLLEQHCVEFGHCWSIFHELVWLSSMSSPTHNNTSGERTTPGLRLLGRLAARSASSFFIAFICLDHSSGDIDCLSALSPAI
ncbi:hypothetical protein CERSUDRAFT_118410 [Gelatoporia subvermispora B]|uniref:Uncharacterized protein n=1 Tax=Ceriporiopsis subvermispora (strain B) TaxID=914234 RepID=M2R278_CERS8|nr:hypothetical protein CERSUDRAFT_118410 [Gelatoporia subvermispora B]